MIEQAARKSDISVAKYVRDRLMPVVAKELGVPLPEFPSLDKRGQPRSARRQAAAIMGEKEFEQWKRQLINEASEKLLAKLGSGAPAPQPFRRSK